MVKGLYVRERSGHGALLGELWQHIVAAVSRLSPWSGAKAMNPQNINDRETVLF